jgi:branched-chain amino acid transport system substrate-binding protein
MMANIPAFQTRRRRRILRIERAVTAVSVLLGGVLALLPVYIRSERAGSTPHSPGPVRTRTLSNQSPILIGISNVQTGSSSSLGRSLVSGSMAYFQAVNARGGIHGRRIQVILKDDQYEPDPAVRNTYELITKDRVFFLFDYVGTPTLTRVLPLLRYFEDRHIVNVAPLTGAEPHRKPPYDRYVFNIRASYQAETHRLVAYLTARGHRRIGFLGQADAYGKSGEVGVTQALQARGLSLAGTASYRRNQPFKTEMREQVEILRRGGADAVIMVGTYAPCAAFIRDARLAGWNVPIANVSFVGAKHLLELLRQHSRSVGQDLTAQLINSHVVPSPSDTRYLLVRAYRAHVPTEDRGFVSLEGWLNAVVVTEALRRAGPSASRATFIRSMESLGGWDPGLGSPLAFSPTCHQGLRNVWLTRAEGGQWVTIKGSGGA